jgi:hypothetical protein
MGGEGLPVAAGGIHNHGRPIDIVQSQGGSLAAARVGGEARVDAAGGDLSGAGESSQ